MGFPWSPWSPCFLRVDRIGKIDRRPAALHLGLDGREGTETLVEQSQVAGREHRLPVHLLDDVAGEQPQLRREAAGRSRLHLDAAGGAGPDAPEVVQLLRVLQRVVELAAREGEAVPLLRDVEAELRARARDVALALRARS